jgi:two-component system response regulator YesN
MMIKVLAVDDEYWIRENLKTIINWEANSFHFLEPAEDGEQALAVVYKENPDILITDISMPFMYGTDLIKEVCNQFPKIICIALSGYSEFEFVRGALVAGAIDYLLKPISKEDLLEVLKIAVSQISAQSTEATINRIPSGQRGSVKETVSQIKNHIDMNYSDDLSLSSLSKQFHVVDSYLSKMFKDIVGENLMLYISRVRIEQAVELIRQGRFSLTEISGLVGYDDYAYFNRVFRKITGMSPREFKGVKSFD